MLRQLLGRSVVIGELKIAYIGRLMLHFVKIKAGFGSGIILSKIRLYLDEDILERSFVKALRNAGAEIEADLVAQQAQYERLAGLNNLKMQETA